MLYFCAFKFSGAKASYLLSKGVSWSLGPVGTVGQVEMGLVD
jgi:hypothetical protein